METLSAWFERLAFNGTDCPSREMADSLKSCPVIITVVGSSGKTSLIEHLAKNLAHNKRKTLITTTTKMFPVSKIPNVTQTGIFNNKTGKFESLPLAELEHITGEYNLVLIEGDGSRKLPLKGWADYEPVVPAFTTITVGVIPVWPLGQPASPELIHRPEQFYAVSGAKAGEILRPVHLAAAITKALFARAWGSRVLFFSQIEDEAALASAGEIAAMLPPAFRSTLSGVLAGSVRQNRVTALT